MIDTSNTTIWTEAEAITKYKDYLISIDFKVTGRYFQELNKYFKYLITINKTYLTVTTSDITGFVVLLKSTKMQNGSINIALKSVRSFYRFLFLNNKITEQYHLNIRKQPTLKPPQPKHSYLTVQEVKDIIEMHQSFNNSTVWNAYKVSAFLWFWFYTGLRPSEMINLKRADIDTKAMKALVRLPTKNSTERYVYFNRFVKNKLDSYFVYEKEKTNAFNVDSKRINGLLGACKQYVPGKTLNAKLFRHSFAHLLVRKNVNMRTAQKLLGHKSLVSTSVYYDPDDITVEQIYREHIK